MDNNTKEKLECLLEDKGCVTYKDLKELNISYAYINKLLKEGVLVKEERGIYKAKDEYISDLFVQQYKYGGIYSLDTALWIHQIAIRVPDKLSLSFPYGTNTKRFKDSDIQPHVLRKDYEKGVVEVEVALGQRVRVYEVERALVECLKPIHKVDPQVVVTAFKKYFIDGKINYGKLSAYAREFRVHDKLISYLEVLS